MYEIYFSLLALCHKAFSFKLAESRRGLKRGMVSVINVDNVT
jgi:hypothetical protein